MVNRYFGILFVVMLAMLPHLSAADRHTPAANRVGRSVVMAPNGMVATSHPLAAQIGLDILRKGGNAVDAAIAVNAALGVVEPMSCGVGGDLFAIGWDAKTQKLYGLNGSGRAPGKATRTFFAEKGFKQIPDSGTLSWSVPGCVDGWDELRKRFGSMNFADILGPSIRYAEDGFPVSEVISDSWVRAEEMLKQHGDTARTYLIDRRSPRPGQVFKNPNLARTYKEIASQGRDAFYKGRVAETIVRFSEKHGGLFTLDDFAKHTSTWYEPVSANYRGYDVWQLPPAGQGIATLQMLNILEGYELNKLGPESPDYWHLFIESKKLAFADRAKYYADPAFAKVPTAELISKPYGEHRRKLIDLKQAMTEVPAGDAKIGKADTVYLCVVDKDRNCVSLIQSIYYGFGSGVVPGDVGFAMQNRGTLFALEEDHLNRLEPGKRPFHTIIPAMVTKDGKPWFVFGVMGGDMQPQGHVQVLVNLIDFGMNVQAAGEAPACSTSARPRRPGCPATARAAWSRPRSASPCPCSRS